MLRPCVVQGHYNYDQYQIIDEMIRSPDLTIAWAVVGSPSDTRKVLLITAPPVSSAARLATLRRLTEREELTDDIVCPYLASGLDERRSWLALEAPEDALSLHELAEALDARPDLAQPLCAARIVADATAALRVVRMHAPSLPATGIGDARVATDGRVLLGHLGEVLTAPRLDEPSQTAELGRWLLRIGGGTRLQLRELADQAVSGSFRYLSDFLDALEAALEDLVTGSTGPSRIEVGRFVSEVRAARPRIAPPALIGELPEPVTDARSQPGAPTRHPTPLQAATPFPSVNSPGPSQKATPKVPPPKVPPPKVPPPKVPPPRSAASPAPVPAPNLSGTPTPLPGTQALGSGAIIAGRYRLEGRIADGRMGRVYEATCVAMPPSAPKVALKILQPAEEDPAMFEEYKARFQREARSLSELSHPNIVKIHDFGFDGECWLAMEYVHGSTLAKLLRTSGQLPVSDVIRISRQLCSALSHAHGKGVIHRDLKPANVILVGDNPGDVRLIDFGLAKHWDGSTDLTDEGTLLGTPHYMSPEQCQGEPGRVESDLYSLGMLMYRLLTGRLPFEGKRGAGILLAHTSAPVPSFRSLNLPFEIPRSIEIVVKRCLEKQPQNRFRSAGELDAALESCEQGAPVMLPQIEARKQTDTRKPADTGPRSPSAAVALPEASAEVSLLTPVWSKRKLMAAMISVAAIVFALVGGATSATVLWMMSHETARTDLHSPPRLDLGSPERPVAPTDVRPEPSGVDLRSPQGTTPGDETRKASPASPEPSPAPSTSPAPKPKPPAPETSKRTQRQTPPSEEPAQAAPKSPMPTKKLD